MKNEELRMKNEELRVNNCPQPLKGSFWQCGKFGSAAKSPLGGV
jgi:hypothetical protein